MEFVSDPECGAVSIFTGITRRDIVEGKGTVVGLEFEAHQVLAISVMEDIVSVYRKNHPDVRNVYICHRLGFVPVGETNVVIAVSSPHRVVALRAVEDLMNELKTHFPVWKKEIFDTGEYIWKDNNNVYHSQNSHVS
jgi:molybdopterin synthase catalytic subunit